jgi:hypothetical protein
MSDKWPSLYEQLGAVLAAPIPFFIAVVVIAWAAWRAWQWRFAAVFNKQKELYDLSRSEVGHWKELAERTTNELNERIGSLQKEKELSEEEKRELYGLTARLAAQLKGLGQANNSVVVTSAVPYARPINPPPVMDWTSDGWKPRNPTNSTSGSG